MYKETSTTIKTFLPNFGHFLYGYYKIVAIFQWSEGFVTPVSPLPILRVYLPASSWQSYSKTMQKGHLPLNNTVNM